MRASSAVVLVVLAGLATGTAEAEWEVNVNFVIGERSMQDDGFWDSGAFTDFDGPFAFGAIADFGEKDWPVRLAAALNVSAESKQRLGQDIAAVIGDVSFGFVWIALEEQAVHPYVGAGVSSVGVYVDDDLQFDDDDQSFGYYLNGGIYWKLGERVNLGADVRALRGTEVDLRGVNLDVDYTQFGLLVGFGW